MVLTPKVSIVMGSYNRSVQLARTLDSIKKQTFQDYEIVLAEDGDDEGKTRTVCALYGVRYFQRKHRPDVIYSNPALPNNIALRNAVGDIVVLMNPENRFMNEDGLGHLVSMVTDTNAVFASVWASEEHNPNTMCQWYCHPVHRRAAFFFCEATKLKHFHYMRGFDEDYKYYGYDDADMAERFTAHGISFEWTDEVILNHQWHDRPSMSAARQPETEQLYQYKAAEVAAGRLGVVRNLDHQWGME